MYFTLDACEKELVARLVAQDLMSVVRCLRLVVLITRRSCWGQLVQQLSLISLGHSTYVWDVIIDLTGPMNSVGTACVLSLQ